MKNLQIWCKLKRKDVVVLHEENETFLCQDLLEAVSDTYERGKNGVEFIDEKILLISFDNYTQRLLTQAILKNLVSDSSAIEYHVCGKFSKCDINADDDVYASYLDTHLMLRKAVNVKKVSLNGKITDYRPR